MSVDPLAPEYPHNSPYAFSENRVVDGVELEGLESITYTFRQNAQTGKFLVTGINTDHDIQKKVVKVVLINQCGELVGCNYAHYSQTNYTTASEKFNDKLAKSTNLYSPGVTMDDVEAVWKERYAPEKIREQLPILEIELYEIPNLAENEDHIGSLATGAELIEMMKDHPDQIQTALLLGMSELGFAEGLELNANNPADNRDAYNLAAELVGEEWLDSFDKQEFYKHKGYVKFNNGATTRKSIDTKVTGKYKILINEKPED